MSKCTGNKSECYRCVSNPNNVFPEEYKNRQDFFDHIKGECMLDESDEW